MKNIFAIIMLVNFVFIIPCSADKIIMRNGDQLIGDVHVKRFNLQTPYGAISLQKTIVSNIVFDLRKTDQVSISSINNDLFSGILLNNNLEIYTEATNQLSIEKNKIKEIAIDQYGIKSYQKFLTLFFMKNKDKFSGKILNNRLNIDMGSANISIRCNHINRVEFFDSDPVAVSILLNNGSRIQGELLNENLLINPHLLPKLSINRNAFNTIQFNVNALVLK